MKQSQKKYMNSEHYRQMLVRDGDRRFQEWHTAFLKYQKDFVNKTSEVRYVSTPDSGSSEVTAPSTESKDNLWPF